MSQERVGFESDRVWDKPEFHLPGQLVEIEGREATIDLIPLRCGLHDDVVLG